MMSLEWLGIYLALGMFVGFMAGLLGIGGGGILVPILVSIFTYQGFAPEHVVHLALGTALACMIITASASLRAHAKKRTVHWPLALGLAPGILLGAFLMGRFAIAINPLVIAVFFAVFMALIALQMLMNWQPKNLLNHVLTYIGGGLARQKCNKVKTGTPAVKPAARAIKPSQLILVGAGIGAISALATVGGGFLTLSYLSYQNIDIKKAIGTSSAIGLAIAIAGTLGYMATHTPQTINAQAVWGFVHWPAFCVIGLSSVLAAPVGVRCATYLAPIYLKRTFALVSILLSAKMFYAVL